MHGGEAFPIEGVDTEAIDTTGAGDMYAGALLYGITSGNMSWKDAGHLSIPRGVADRIPNGRQVGS